MLEIIEFIKITNIENHTHIYTLEIINKKNFLFLKTTIVTPTKAQNRFENI